MLPTLPAGSRRDPGSMFGRRAALHVEIESTRLILRPPVSRDYEEWAALRRDSRTFLEPWEPTWSADHLTRRSFRNRVLWVERAIKQGEALPLLLITRDAARIVGGLTLSNIRRHPAEMATLGYWTGVHFTRRGYMTEAINALREYAFSRMDLSRLEAACLPENDPSRQLLERCRFKYEGVAQAYLQIAGRWRNHVLYAALRADRRGRVEGS